MIDCSAPYTYDFTSLENPKQRDDLLRPRTLCPIQIDAPPPPPPLDDPPRRTRGTSITFLQGPQQTLQNSKRKNESFTPPTPSTMNATTTANILDRPL